MNIILTCGMLIIAYFCYYNYRESGNFEEVHGHLRRGDIVGVTGYPGEYSDH
jgi:hypothetical protein